MVLGGGSLKFPWYWIYNPFPTSFTPIPSFYHPRHADGHDQDVVVPDNLITIAEVRGGLKRFKLLRWLYLSPHAFRRCYQVITQSFKYLNFTKLSSEFTITKILSTVISNHHLKELPTKIVLTSFFCCLGGFSACIAPTCYCKLMVQICALSKKNTHRFPIPRRLATFAGVFCLTSRQGYTTWKINIEPKEWRLGRWFFFFNRMIFRIFVRLNMLIFQRFYALFTHQKWLFHVFF